MQRRNVGAVLLSLALGFSRLAFSADRAADLGPKRVGEEVHLTFSSPQIPAPMRKEAAPRMVWRQEIYYPEATYIAPHFTRFDLPAGARLIVRAPDGRRSWTYIGMGHGNMGRNGGLWGIVIGGDTAVLELWAAGRVPAGAIEMDRFAHGVVDLSRAFGSGVGTKSVCGADDSQYAKCYQSTEPVIYSKSKAVVDLIINGKGSCTGFLVGSAGHLLTNNHCISSQAEANNTTYQLMNEANCGVYCYTCPGTVVIATSATLVKTDATLDYTLLQLPTNPTLSYGFFKMSTVPAVVDQRIYIPGHPGGAAKKISVLSSDPTDQSGFCEVTSTSTAGSCAGYTSPINVGYMCDTSPGVSGAPVVAYSNHLVVALHGCGNCSPNTGRPIGLIINALGSALPPNSTGNSCAASNQVCTYDADCCSNMCWIKTSPKQCV
jgi:lysyl endopeptidase